MTASIPKVLLVGPGGVGVITAYSLEFDNKAEVTAVVRSDYKHATEKGYEIDSVDYGKIPSYKPTHIVDSVEKAKEYGPFDYIVITTKNLPDILKLEDLIEPAVTKESVVILVQNGIGLEMPFLEKYPNNAILSGVQMIASTNYSGRIHHETTDELRLGYYNNKNLTAEAQKAICEKFLSIYKTPHNLCEYDPDVNFGRWRKLVYNGTFNPICTLLNLDVGRLELFGGVESLIRPAMDEIYKIAASEGYVLPEEVKEIMIRSDDGLYYSPSMLVDYRKGNYMEVEVIAGNPVRIAQKNGVDAPILTIIYNLLKLVQSRIKEQKGAIVVPKVRPIKE